MTSTKKAIGFGLLTWLIPFVVSFGFYNADGELRTDIFLFKSIMIVVAAAVSTGLLVRYFRSVEGDAVKEAIQLGVLWLCINWLLDIVVLIPFSGMAYQEYFYQIGLRYFMIPIIAYGFGKVAQK